MYFISDTPIKTAEIKSEKIITSNLSEIILKDISNMEEDISIAYEIGGMDLMNYLVKNLFKSPTRISYFKNNLKPVLNCIGNEPASAKLIERWLSDENFEKVLIRNGVLERIKNLALHSDAMAREYINALLNYDFSHTKNSVGNIDKGVAIEYYFEKIENFIRTRVDVEDELDIWSAFPKLLAEQTFEEIIGDYDHPQTFHGNTSFIKKICREYYNRKGSVPNIKFEDVIEDAIKKEYFLKSSEENQDKVKMGVQNFSN